MALDQRTCPVCLSEFVPRRVDQLFDVLSCRQERYSEEYEALYYEFPLALRNQGFACFFACDATAPETKLHPLKLNGTDQWVAACMPCKKIHYAMASQRLLEVVG